MADKGMTIHPAEPRRHGLPTCQLDYDECWSDFEEGRVAE